MNWKDALGTFQLGQRKEGLKPLMTDWGKRVDPKHVLEEYPRPQFVRDNWESLNGYWNYTIQKEGQKQMPEIFDGKILVPFSPETLLSGVQRQLMPGEVLWYQREVTISRIPEGRRLLLHFGAVDQECVVFVGRKKAGAHMGGYLPFCLDITPWIVEGKNELSLCCRDKSDAGWQSRGKQKLKRGGMFYTAQSGIWQPVWMEWVPDTYVQEFFIHPDYDGGQVRVEIVTAGKRTSQRIALEAYAGKEPVGEAKGLIREGRAELTVKLSRIHPWSPEDPFLYGLKIRCGEDRGDSYFAMRIFTKEKDSKGIVRICLNHQPYFQNGVLDQGYWPESLMTPPSDQAMVSDILRMKKLGFNMLRKHCKIEPLRFYYHCDRLGMILWQDMVNGGDCYPMWFLCYIPTLFPRLAAKMRPFHRLTGRKSRAGRAQWEKECGETIRHLFNVPSIGVWVLFNEGWGQFDTDRLTRKAKAWDPDRLVEGASGWFRGKEGDIVSVHNYFRRLTCPKDLKRALVISEYGGMALPVPGHISSLKRYGYRIMNSREEFQKAFWGKQEEIRRLEGRGLSGAVYTQLSDIEDEINGILTYDRDECKLESHCSKKNP